MDEEVTIDLYEVNRDYPDLLVASVTAKRDDALREINHYMMIYGQDGDVRVQMRKPEQPHDQH